MSRVATAGGAASNVILSFPAQPPSRVHPPFPREPLLAVLSIPHVTRREACSRGAHGVVMSPPLVALVAKLSAIIVGRAIVNRRPVELQHIVIDPLFARPPITVIKLRISLAETDRPTP
jgi:hypothetical protein